MDYTRHTKPKVSGSNMYSSSFTNRTIVMIVMSVVTMTCLFPCSLGKTSACSCNYGNVDIDTPQCVCACFQDYLQPHCLYTSTQQVPMGLYINVTSRSFSSDAYLATLSWALNVKTSSKPISFVFAKSVVQNMTYARFLMEGAYAQQLLWDSYSNNSWLPAAQIVGVWEEMLQLPSQGGISVDTTTVLYRSSDGKITVTISTIAWLIGALVVAGLTACSDSLFLRNNEEDVRAVAALMNEQYHFSRTMTQARQAQAAGAYSRSDVRQIKSGPRNPLDTPPLDLDS